MKLKRRKTDRGYIYMFYCPACMENHTFDVRENEWTFDGNWENPSFSPSLNLIPHGGRCHLFVKNGIIEYCGDCRHHFSGQNIPMVEYPE